MTNFLAYQSLPDVAWGTIFKIHNFWYQIYLLSRFIDICFFTIKRKLKSWRLKIIKSNSYPLMNLSVPTKNSLKDCYMSGVRQHRQSFLTVQRGTTVYSGGRVRFKCALFSRTDQVHKNSFLVIFFISNPKWIFDATKLESQRILF